MAIEPVMADVIRQLRSTLPNDRVLCLGYPDILQAGEPPEDEERKQIAAWHRWKGGIEHAGHFFGCQNLKPEYWDVTQARGPERIVDLNDTDAGYDVESWLVEPTEYRGEEGKFALVIDPGTIEHIANIGNCWRTICAVTSMNGLVIHSNPITMANHGFYSIHPTAYVDIYEANGFQVQLLLELSGPKEKRVIREVPKVHRYEPAANAVMLVAARKTAEVPFTWPIQTKYRSNPNLKRAAE